MAVETDTLEAKAHELIGQLNHGKLAAVVHVMEAMLNEEDDEELTAEEARSLRAADERFRNGGQTIPFEQLVEELGFTMDQVRSGTLPPGKA